MFKYGQYNIPGHMKESINRFAQEHRPVGGFLTAVLENDLKEACGRADEGNQKLLFEYCRLLYMEVPSDCWGSPEKVKDWLSWTDKEPCENCKEMGIPVRWYPLKDSEPLVHRRLCEVCASEGIMKKGDEEVPGEPE